jgi:hypothetical protein
VFTLVKRRDIIDLQNNLSTETLLKGKLIAIDQALDLSRLSGDNHSGSRK